MPLPRFATLIGGLLLSRSGRRIAGRHAGKLALASAALHLLRQRRSSPAGRQAAPRNRRWSGRKP